MSSIFMTSVFLITCQTKILLNLILLKFNLIKIQTVLLSNSFLKVNLKYSIINFYFLFILSTRFSNFILIYHPFELFNWVKSNLYV